MRNKSLITLCLIVTLLSASMPAFCSEQPGPTAVAADLVIARPLCLAVTILGSALFLVSLPVAALSHSVDKTAKALVGKPADATFSRPLGDFSTMTSD
jgi:hypothetical protein